MNKKCLIISAVILSFVMAISCFSLTAKNDVSYASAISSSAAKIIIDAGHGGFDGGAVASDGTNEKDINLSIALSLGDMLSLCGYDVIYTRTSDTGTEDNSDVSISKRKVSDLNNRLKIMEENSDAVFVSIHLNKFTATTPSGAQVFYSSNNIKSRDLAVSVQNSIVSMLQNDNKRVVKKSDSSTFLLKKANIPAVIVECGFVSNAKELALLKDDNYQKQMAFAVFYGINEFIINEV